MKRIQQYSGLLLAAGCWLLLLSACGFHLRGTQTLALPPELTPLHVKIRGQVAASDPLLRLMQAELQGMAGAALAAADKPAAELVLYNERLEQRVLSVSPSSAKVTEYLLIYRLSFKVLDPGRRELVAPQTIHLQRDYTFDSLSVLAKEHESIVLRDQIRREAVQLIVQRLARARLKTAEES